MVTLFLAQMETPRRPLITAVLLIACGVALASYGELNLSVVGVVVMFLSETFEATRLVMTQVLLVGLRFHPSAPPTPHLCSAVLLASAARVHVQ